MPFARPFAACLIALCTLLHPVAAAAQHDIVLGMSAAFSGPTRGLGIELYRGAQACFNAVNHRGGIHGRTIGIAPLDDGYNPMPAVDNTVRLVEDEDVFGLFGYVGTPTTTRVIPLLRRYARQNQLMLFPLTGAEPLRRPPYDKWIFNLRPSYSNETRGLVENFMLTGRQRIAVFYQADAFGRSGWDGVRKALARFELVIAAEATYRRGATFHDDMTRQAEIIKEQAPEAVILVGTSEACAAFIRDARDTGLDVPMGILSFSNPQKLARLLTPLGENVEQDYTRDLVASQVVPSFRDTTLPAVREYHTTLDAHDPGPPPGLAAQDYDAPRYSYISFEGFLAAKVLVEALSRIHGTPLRGQLRHALESLRGFDLGIGEPVTFTPDRHQALSTIYFTTVHEGRLVPLDSFRRWNK